MKTQKLFSTLKNGRCAVLQSAVFSVLVVLGLYFGATETVSAQTQMGIGKQATSLRMTVNPTLLPSQNCQPETVYIRNLRYDDYSRYTRLSTTAVDSGKFFQIITSCIPLNGQIVVTIQDVKQSGFGVTAYRLTNVRVSRGVLTVQAPTLPILRNRTYHVAIFVYGQQPGKTANPGQITIR